MLDLPTPGPPRTISGSLVVLASARNSINSCGVMTGRPALSVGVLIMSIGDDSGRLWQRVRPAHKAAHLFEDGLGFGGGFAVVFVLAQLFGCVMGQISQDALPHGFEPRVAGEIQG